MVAEDVGSIYRKWGADLGAEGIELLFGPQSRSSNGSTAWFRPPDVRHLLKPLVVVYGETEAAARAGGLDQLLNLAHEIGHVRRWQQGLRKEACDLPVSSSLSAGEKADVLAEEAAAWEIARAELLARSFTDWEAFDARRLDSVKAYDRLLGIR